MTGSAPDLKHRLTLEQPERISDGAGGYNTQWTVLGLLWAAPEAKTVSESHGVSAAKYRIIVRAAPQGSPQRPVPGQRLRLGTRVWTIESVVETDFSGRYLACHVIEEVAT